METKVSDFINLNARLGELNLSLNNDFCILPENIEDANSLDEFIFTDTAVQVRKYLKRNGVDIAIIKNENNVYRQRRSIDFYAPLLFIGYSVFSENATFASVGLNVLSNYITDFFKGSFVEKKVKVEIIVEVKPKSKYKSIVYEGSVDGLNSLNEIIKNLKDE